MNDIKDEVISIISIDTGLKNEEVQIEKPPREEMGDFALPCFALSRKLRKSPTEIAKELASKIMPREMVKEVKAQGPYVNIYLDRQAVANDVLNDILKNKQDYGCSGIGKGKTVMVEYSSPNTNKPLHLGHLRNDSIGMAISNILQANGNNVIRSILFSNRGIHICKSMLAYQKWGEGKDPDIKPDHFVGKYYVMFEQKKTPEIEEEAQLMLQKWEQDDKATRELWEKMDSWAVQGFHETYKNFGSLFDVEFRESDYYDKAKPVIDDGMEKGVFTKDDKGGIIADLEDEGLSKKAILRSDGTSIYMTNDLALTKHKFEHFNLEKAYWVVGSEQNLYFRQLFRIFEKLEFSWAKDCHHISYGLVYLPEGKMKSREGKVVDADDIIAKMKSLAKEEVLKRHESSEEKISENEAEDRARMIGLGALKFFLLKADQRNDIYFDPKETLSFEGDTGPYVQYAYARICSVMRKAGLSKEDAEKLQFDLSLLKEKQEEKLIISLMEYPDYVARAGKELKPHIISNYLLELSHSFNDFYHQCPILSEEESLKNSRLALSLCVRQVIKNGLSLLNIESPEKM